MAEETNAGMIDTPHSQMTVRDMQDLPKLSPKRQTFLVEYSKSGNATQAAVRAGYSPTSARQQGYRILANRFTQEALLAYGLLALDVLADLAENGQSGMIKIRAASKLVDVCIPKNTNEQSLEPRKVIIEHRDLVAEHQLT